MFIPDYAPSSLAEMYAFLLPSAEDGLFDSVSLNEPETPSEIICRKNGHVILRMTCADSVWRITPYVADGIAASSNRCFLGYRIANAVRCAGGISFVSNTVSGLRYVFLIAKTSDGKTGCISFSQHDSYTENERLHLYPVCCGDNTALDLYTRGYEIITNFSGADRTILTRIPVVGTRGCTEYFTGAYVRNVMQCGGNEEQIIGGNHYGCFQHIALWDEVTA